MEIAMEPHRRLATITCVLSLFVGCSFAGDTRDSAPRPVLSISTRTTSVSIGTPVVLRAKFSNDSTSPLLLSFRSENFRVRVAGVGSTHTVTIPSYTAARSDHFKYVPLLPESSYEWVVPASINDLAAIPETATMLEPGTYQIALEYDAPGATELDTAWIGSATSNKQTVIISPVSTEALDEWRSRIAGCVRSQDCDTVSAANFYRAVRDRLAADSLVALLEQTPLSVWLLDAVVHQGRRDDAERLRSLSRTVPDPALKEMYLAAANRL
jgi:hypothetical protein